MQLRAAVFIALVACSPRVAEPIKPDPAYLPIAAHMTTVTPDEAPGEMTIDDQDTFPLFTIGALGLCQPVGDDGPYPTSRRCCKGKVCVTEHRSIREP